MYSANIIQTLQQNHESVLQGITLTTAKFCKGVFSILLEMPLSRERLAALWLILVGHKVH